MENAGRHRFGALPFDSLCGRMARVVGHALSQLAPVNVARSQRDGGFRMQKPLQAAPSLAKIIGLLANPVGLINCRRGHFLWAVPQARSSCGKLLHLSETIS